MQQGMVVLPGMVSFLGAEPVCAKPDTWTSARVCVMYDAINSVAQCHRYTILTAGECLKPTKPTPGTFDVKCLSSYMVRFIFEAAGEVRPKRVP